MTRRIRCPACQRLTHPAELVRTPALGLCCLRCLEDARPELEGR
jgi:bacterioferritin-associated ferredoxin